MEKSVQNIGCLGGRGAVSGVFAVGINGNQVAAQGMGKTCLGPPGQWLISDFLAVN